MKKITLILVLVLGIYTVHAQVIENKVNLNLGYGMGWFSGQSLIEDQSFSSPSLFANYKTTSGFTLTMLYNQMKPLRIGLDFEYVQASEWKLKEQTEYIGSSIKQFSAGPVVQYTYGFNQSRASEWLTAFVGFSPMIGYTNLSLRHPFFDIESTGGTIEQPMESSDLFFDMKLDAGLEAVVWRNIAVFVSYAYSYGWTKSLVYPDTQFSCNMVKAGIVLHLIRNKRYFY
ncbi:MAG: outer membrane beta-barrel protein [Bacteroidales bacterium]|nr:outer membrane beta-barrel protein [Bacteroidales bacterium]